MPGHGCTDPIPAARRPSRPPTRSPRSAPGILRLQLPIQMPGLGHVNCYALEDERGWTVVDPGHAGPEVLQGDGGAVRRRRLPACRTSTPSSSPTATSTTSAGPAGSARRPAPTSSRRGRSARGGTPTTSTTSTRGKVSTSTAASPWDRRDPVGRPAPAPAAEGAAHATRVLRPLIKRVFATPSPSVRLDDAEVIRFGRREWVAVHTPGPHARPPLPLRPRRRRAAVGRPRAADDHPAHQRASTPGPTRCRAFVESLDKVSPARGRAARAARPRLPVHRPATAGSTTSTATTTSGSSGCKGYLAEAGEASVIDLSQQLFRQQVWGADGRERDLRPPRAPAAGRRGHPARGRRRPTTTGRSAIP